MTTLETLIKNSAEVVDPVCGMKVDPAKTKFVSTYQGKSYWFCAEACRRAFEADPGKYLEREPAGKKGRFRKWLDRMAKSNREVFGSSGPKCH